MTVDGNLVEILRQKGFSYYDDRIKLVVDEWAKNGGYDQENWYENLFGKLLLSNTISIKYQKLFDQLEKIIDEIELFGKNGILQKRIRERLKEQELDYTDETKLAIEEWRANIGVKRVNSLEELFEELGIGKIDAKEIERKKNYEEGYKEGYDEGFENGYDEAWEEEFNSFEDTSLIVVHYLKQMYDDDYIIKTTGVSRRYLGFLKDILQGLKEDENGELEPYEFKSKTKAKAKGLIFIDPERIRQVLADSKKTPSQKRQD